VDEEQMSRHRFIRSLAHCGLAGMLAMAATVALAADERFDITRFQVEGNTLLPPAKVERLVNPLAGPQRTFADIQLAIEALQEAYRKAGYTTVQVSVPEQELAGGAVTLLVRETVISSITISGNEHFDEANIRASLVRLQVGRTPSLGAISESIQLANESPAKQVAVTLAEGDKPGTIDAKVLVTDNNPLRIITTLDNTGSPSSGRWRTGVAVQHANLFNRDQVGTLAYTTSPDSPAGVNLRVYSAGYRIPLYAYGDSVDFIYGKSSVNSPSTSPVLGGLLGFTGKGDIYGLRWNHFLGRSGESTAKLVLGLDHKMIDSRCDVGGVTVSIAPPTPPIASCVPYKTTPLSITYSSQSEGVDQISGYSVGLSRNLPSGERYTNIDGRTDRYSYLTPGNRAAVTISWPRGALPRCSRRLPTAGRPGWPAARNTPTPPCSPASNSGWPARRWCVAFRSGPWRPTAAWSPTPSFIRRSSQAASGCPASCAVCFLWMRATAPTTTWAAAACPAA
jgi:hemolysin activation/secretion protein